MGLEPTTPCLQIRPTWTVADGGERFCLINRASWTVANDGERQRMFDRCSIAPLSMLRPAELRSPHGSREFVTPHPTWKVVDATAGPLMNPLTMFTIRTV
jgi:hypothetical protein